MKVEDWCENGRLGGKWKWKTGVGVEDMGES